MLVAPQPVRRDNGIGMSRHDTQLEHTQLGHTQLGDAQPENTHLIDASPAWDDETVSRGATDAICNFCLRELHNAPIHQCKDCACKLCTSCIFNAMIIHPDHTFKLIPAPIAQPRPTLTSNTESLAADSDREHQQHVITHTKSAVPPACCSCSRALSALRYKCSNCSQDQRFCLDCSSCHPAHHKLHPLMYDDDVKGGLNDDDKIVDMESDDAFGLDNDDTESVDDEENGHVEENIGASSECDDFGADDSSFRNSSDSEDEDDGPDVSEGAVRERSKTTAGKASHDKDTQHDNGDTTDGQVERNNGVLPSELQLKTRISSSHVTISFPKPFFLQFTKAMCQISDMMCASTSE